MIALEQAIHQQQLDGLDIKSTSNFGGVNPRRESAGDWRVIVDARVPSTIN